MGHPAEGYPFDWSVYAWLPGENASGTIDDLDQAAVDLAEFVSTAPSRYDGCPSASASWSRRTTRRRRRAVRRSIAQLGDRIDGDATLRSWEESLNAPVWGGEEGRVHGDLLPGNLLVDGRLSAVIDFGGLNVGDPRVTCSLRGTCSQVTAASGTEPNSRSTMRHGCAAAAGRSPRPCGAAVLLGHQPRDDPPGIARAGAGPRRHLAYQSGHDLIHEQMQIVQPGELVEAQLEVLDSQSYEPLQIPRDHVGRAG